MAELGTLTTTLPDTHKSTEFDVRDRSGKYLPINGQVVVIVFNHLSIVQSVFPAYNTRALPSIPVIRTPYHYKPIPTFSDTFEDRYKFAMCSGKISGIVKVEGAPIAGCTVRLYYRKNGLYVAQTETDAVGYYEFLFLDVGSQFTVIAFQDTWNAVVLDSITPILQ